MILHLCHHLYRVWVLTAKGKSLKMIAAEMRVSLETVSKYRAWLYSELGVSCAVDAAMKAVAYRIVLVPKARGRVKIGRAFPLRSRRNGR